MNYIKIIMKKFYNKFISILNNFTFFFFSMKYRIKVMTSLNTIEYIKKNKCSVARFGDGELNMILREKDIGFQKYNPQLSERLKNILVENNPNLLVCLPHVFSYFSGECLRAKEFWKSFLLTNKQEIYEMLRVNKMEKYYFGDTQMTRPYIDYIDFHNAQRVYKKLKELWNNQGILIVEGFATRMGVGNDLFNNASCVKRIICPSENAFEYYEQIIESVFNNYCGQLVLIALGPTATVLAADLSKYKIWALDVGHLDIEYEWYINGATEKSIVKGKYVNEVLNGSVVEEYCDQIYVNQIITKILEEE